MSCKPAAKNARNWVGGERYPAGQAKLDFDVRQAALGGNPLQVYREKRRQMGGIMDILKGLKTLFDDQGQQAQEADLIGRSHQD